MNRVIVFLLLVLCLYLPALYSQPSVQITDIEDFSLGNLQVATDAHGIKSYFCYYEVKDPATDGKKYAVRAYDTSFTETGNCFFSCTGREYLLSTACNGTDFIAIILNPKKKILYHRVYNIASKNELQFEDKLDVNSQFYLEKHIDPETNLPGATQLLQVFGDGSFVSLIPTKHNNVFTYDVNIFPKSKGYQKLLYTPETNFKTQQTSFVGSTSELLLFYVFRKKELSSNKYETMLLGVEAATGKQQFEVSTSEGEFPYLPLKVAYQPGQKDFTLLGNYFKENGKVKRAKSAGLCLLRMDATGQITTANRLNWKQYFEIDEPLNEIENEERKDTTAREIKLFQVHAFTQYQDGSLYISGEGYRFRERPGLIVANVLLAGAGVGLAAANTGWFVGGGGIYGNTFRPMDMVLIHAGSNLLIDSITRIPKQERYAAAFDTDFSLHLPAENQTLLAFRDYGQYKGDDQFTSKLLHIGNQPITTIQANVLTKAPEYRILPASGNAVVLAEYYPRKKQLLLSKKLLF